MPSSYTVAIAQPRHRRGADVRPNVKHAAELVERAGRAGADLICFPEFSPGPVRSVDPFFDAAPTMANAARTAGLNVVWSRTERCEDGRARLCVYVVDRRGDTVFRYARTHPATIPPAETGDEWIWPGDDFANFVLDDVPMGIAVCSEMWTPEVPRILALRGAELILSPAGGGFTSLTQNWQLVNRVRAIENLCYVALTNNLWGDEAGAAMIAGPEHPVVFAGRAELAVGVLDLDRLRWLRAHDDSILEPKPFDSIPGLLRARRPELYGDLVAPMPDAFDYRGGRECPR